MGAVSVPIVVGDVKKLNSLLPEAADSPQSSGAGLTVPVSKTTRLPNDSTSKAWQAKFTGVSKRLRKVLISLLNSRDAKHQRVHQARKCFTDPLGPRGRGRRTARGLGRKRGAREVGPV